MEITQEEFNQNISGQLVSLIELLKEDGQNKKDFIKMVESAVAILSIEIANLTGSSQSEINKKIKKHYSDNKGNPSDNLFVVK